MLEPAFDRPGAPRAEPVSDPERPIFILGCSWRCGSTLLQRYVNSTKAAFVWGENLALTAAVGRLLDPVRAWGELSREQAETFRVEAHGAWIANLNPCPEQATRRVVRAALAALYGPPTAAMGLDRWGFKEVRHGAEEARLLLAAFPHARIIFVVRRVQDVLASNLSTGWIDQVGGADGVLRQWIGACASMARIDDRRILTLRYEDLCADRAAVTARLADHLEIDPSSFQAGVLYAPIRGALSPPRSTPLAEVERARPAVRALMDTYYGAAGAWGPEGAEAAFSRRDDECRL